MGIKLRNECYCFVTMINIRMNTPHQRASLLFKISPHTFLHSSQWNTFNLRSYSLLPRQPNLIFYLVFNVQILSWRTVCHLTMKMLTQHSTGLTTLHSLVTFLIGLNLCVVSFWKLLKSSKSQLLKYMYCCFPFFFINTDSLILIKLLNLIDLNLLFSDIVPPFFKTMPACVMVRYFFFFLQRHHQNMQRASQVIRIVPKSNVIV